MPHCFKMQHRPMAFSHQPSTPQNKHGFGCELLHEFCEKWATKVPNHINGEPNNQGKLHLLVRRELKREKGSKNSPMEAWGLLFLYFPWAWKFLKWGGRVLGEENVPPPLLYIFVQGLLAQASSARPGELTCTSSFFFLGETLILPHPPYGLAFAYSNLLKL